MKLKNKVSLNGLNQVKQVMQTNNSVRQFMEYLEENKDFTPEEKDTMQLVKDHLVNLNVILSKIKK